MIKLLVRSERGLAKGLCDLVSHILGIEAFYMKKAPVRTLHFHQ
jgi:hypothetical protein